MRGERKEKKKHGRKKPEDSPWNCLSVGQSQQENTVKEEQRETEGLTERLKQNSSSQLV